MRRGWLPAVRPSQPEHAGHPWGLFQRPGPSPDRVLKKSLREVTSYFVKSRRWADTRGLWLRGTTVPPYEAAPKLVVCGHIHEARGIVQGVGDFEGTIFVNAANLVASRDRGGSSKKSGVRPAILWDRENGAVEMALPESA